MGERIGVSDEEWSLIGPLLPAEHGRGCRPARNNRLYFEGMMWMARTGAQWRHLPDEYGKWNSVFRRYRRWVETGVFDAILKTLAEMVERDRTADMIDSTIVRAHHCAVGIKRGLRKPRRLADRAAASPPSSTHFLPTRGMTRTPSARRSPKPMSRRSSLQRAIAANRSRTIVTNTNGETRSSGSSTISRTGGVSQPATTRHGSRTSASLRSPQSSSGYPLSTKPRYTPNSPLGASTAA